MVDPEDDSIERFVVWRFRYDAARRERRKVAGVAFDNKAEFNSYLQEAAVRLNREKQDGLAELQEHYSGTRKESGYRERIRRRRRGES